MRGIIVPKAVAGDGELINKAEDAAKRRFWSTYWDKIEFPNCREFSWEHRHYENHFQFQQTTTSFFRAVDGRGPMPLGAETMEPGVAMLIFQDLEEQSPGSWAIDMEGTFPDPSVYGDEGRGLSITLSNCLPTPAPHVPLDRIFAFKERHEPERDALFSAIDRLYLETIGSPDRPLAENAALSDLQAAIKDQVSAARSSNSIDFNLLDLSASYNIVQAGITTIATYAAGLPLLESLLTGALAGPGASVGPTFSYRSEFSKRPSPYGYVGKIKERLEW
ncbi:DUF6236 family protein [Roseibium album]|uniref:DUF6236 family protein n=1 Tax=Roseibium album TaxID=311410 RepID=UPI0024925A01|nr:DUF6236 family protein [Roseibium album]